MFEECFAIEVEFLHVLGSLPVDAYIKLSQEKFLMYLRKGEIFQSRDQKMLQNKKVQKLYVRWCDEDQHQIINSIRSGFDRLVEKKGVPLDEKIFLMHSQIQNFFALEKTNQALSKFIIEIADDSALEILKKIRYEDLWKLKKSTELYPANLFTVQSFLLLFILNNVDLKSRNECRSLILYSLLHTMNLSSKFLKIKTKNEFQVLKYLMGSEEINCIQDHFLTTNKQMKDLGVLFPDLINLDIYDHRSETEELGLQVGVFNLTLYLAKEILDSENTPNLEKIIVKIEKSIRAKNCFKEPFLLLQSLFREYPHSYCTTSSSNS